MCWWQKKGGWFCWLQQTAPSESGLVKYAVLQSRFRAVQNVTEADGADHTPTNGVKHQLRCRHLRPHTFTFFYMETFYTDYIFRGKPQAWLAFPPMHTLSRCVKDVVLQKQQVPSSSCPPAQAPPSAAPQLRGQVSFSCVFGSTFPHFLCVFD